MMNRKISKIFLINLLLIVVASVATIVQAGQNFNEARTHWDATYRPVIIQNVLNRIADEADDRGFVGWREEVQAHLERLSTNQLNDVQGAQSYNEVITIIRGGDIIANSFSQFSELSSAPQLGDTEKDLVYTPLPPCRIVDTRTNNVKFGNSQTRMYSINGNTTGQGGAADCGVPDEADEPEAVVLNITSTQGEGNGFITAYPITASRPLASVLNYQTADVANAVVLKSGIGGLNEIAVFASASTHVVIDVMGYLGKPGTTEIDMQLATKDQMIPNDGLQRVVDAECPQGYVATGGGFFVSDEPDKLKIVGLDRLGPSTFSCSFINNDLVPKLATCRAQCMKLPF